MSCASRAPFSLPLLALGPLLPLLLVLSSAAPSSAFWITVELLRVDWREGCLTTANGGCSQPRFKILEHMLPLNEKVSISWPVSENFVQDSARQFVSHWTSGKPEDVSLSCQVVGVDPMYGFPRVCDQSNAQRPYPADSGREVAVGHSHESFTRSRRHEIIVEAGDDDKRRIIEVRARCFNASLAVQKHTERCPWCPDPAALTVIGNELPEENPAAAVALLPFGRWSEETQLLQWILLLLALVSVAVSAALSCLVVAYCRQKRSLRGRNSVVKTRHQNGGSSHGHNPYQTQTRHFLGMATAKPPPFDHEERRYDSPWKQSAVVAAGGCRPLTYGLFSSHSSKSGESSSGATTTSPLDSGSSIGFGGASSYRALVQPPSTRIYHQIGSPHSDSGLESV